jgi:hypothetical protein
MKTPVVVVVVVGWDLVLLEEGGLAVPVLSSSHILHK